VKNRCLVSHFTDFGATGNFSPAQNSGIVGIIDSFPVLKHPKKRVICCFQEVSLVENLTLSKMTCRPLDSAGMVLEGLHDALEKSISPSPLGLNLDVSYLIDGQPITRDVRVRFKHAGGFACTICGKSVKKLFDRACWPCLQSSAQADRCVLNPVGCHFMAGTCREPAWGEEFCYQPHYVYISFTDKYKVGITRRNQIPTRWIDQGATMAVLVAAVGSRHQAGILEDYLSQKFADKSHWMKMLKTGNNRPSVEEFNQVRGQALELLREGLDGSQAEKLRAALPEMIPTAADVRLLDSAQIVSISFPLWNPLPEKITSLNLDKSPVLESEVLGIKGQYLILDTGVFNVRRHEGYVVNFEIQS
jgi:hypothetical protein